MKKLPKKKAPKSKKPVKSAKPKARVAPKPPAKPAVKPTVKPPVPAPKVAGKPPVKIKIAGGKSVPVERSPKIAQNGITRPGPTWKDGTPKITFRVWQIADEVSAAHAKEAEGETKRTGTKVKAKPAARAEVMPLCLKEGISYAVFQNEFYRWRKFNGLFGRVKLDGSLGVVTGGPGKCREILQTKPLAKPAAVKPAILGKPPVAKPAAKVFPFPVPAVAKPILATAPTIQG